MRRLTSFSRRNCHNASDPRVFPERNYVGDAQKRPQRSCMIDPSAIDSQIHWRNHQLEKYSSERTNPSERVRLTGNDIIGADHRWFQPWVGFFRRERMNEGYRCSLSCCWDTLIDRIDNGHVYSSSTVGWENILLRLGCTRRKTVCHGRSKI